MASPDRGPGDRLAAAEHRRRIDADLAPHLEGWGDRRVEAETKRAAYRLDPHGYLARCRGAAADRRVTLRPAPDTMAILTGYLPVAQGVSAFAALGRHADALRAHGDARTRGQIMADTLVQRLTGQPNPETGTRTGTRSHADVGGHAGDTGASTGPVVPVEVQLVMTDQALFNHGPGRDEPAHLHGYGPIPAELARRLVLATTTPDSTTDTATESPTDSTADIITGTARTEVGGRGGGGGAMLWLRRLYTAPHTGRLVAMESHRRVFDGRLASFLVVRDRVCRTPWCDAPIRHSDHVTPAAAGGPTTAANGQGLCEACNHAKTAPGWHAHAHQPDGAGAAVQTTTPTGHTYTSRPPDPPHAPTPRRMDLHFQRLIDAA